MQALWSSIFPLIISYSFLINEHLTIWAFKVYQGNPHNCTSKKHLHIKNFCLFRLIYNRSLRVKLNNNYVSLTCKAFDSKEVSWCSWLSRQSNTLKVCCSNPGDAMFFFLFALCLFQTQWKLKRKEGKKTKGPNRVRTGDLLICSQMLYHWAMDPLLR